MHFSQDPAVTLEMIGFLYQTLQLDTDNLTMLKLAKYLKISYATLARLIKKTEQAGYLIRTMESKGKSSFNYTYEFFETCQLG